MRCGTVRRQLWLPNGPEAVTPERAPALAHVRACAACQRFFADQGLLESVTRSCDTGLRAPVELRRRVFDRLAATRPNSARRSHLRLAAAAGLAIVAVSIVVGTALGVRPGSDWSQSLLTLADEHQRAIQGGGIRSDDTTAIHDWLAERVTFAPHVPEFPGAALVGARLSDIKGRGGAVVCYRVDGRDVSFYLAPRDASAPALRPAEMVSAASRGHHLVAWQGAGLTHVLVGELPEARLRQLARHCLDAPVSSPGV